eukprot:TRINITY_DN28103_c1_g1_i1.p1 TRINITY_DN28103_c1_g1~~TRINITY_DN28103_c1_g1_i1.p1  ORF type:complete len:846 (-),score=126.90 TRINITY_DN28103_c1_g1_i1:315-2852(-)
MGNVPFAACTCSDTDRYLKAAERSVQSCQPRATRTTNRTKPRADETEVGGGTGFWSPRQAEDLEAFDDDNELSDDGRGLQQRWECCSAPPLADRIVDMHDAARISGFQSRTAVRYQSPPSSRSSRVLPRGHSMMAMGPLNRRMSGAKSPGKDLGLPHRRSFLGKGMFGKLDASPEADEEALGWLNFALEHLWPYAEKAVADHLRSVVLPAIQEDLPAALRNIQLKRLSLGNEAPVLGPCKVYKKEVYKRDKQDVSKGEMKLEHIELNVGLHWSCGAGTDLEVLGANVGISRLTLTGEVVLVFKPILEVLPIVGGMQIFLIVPPRLDMEFNGAVAFAQLPVISDAVKKAIMASISNSLVLPNRIYTHWIAGKEHQIDLAAMRFPPPEGVLRLRVMQARSLSAHDWKLLSAASSDPYVAVTLGDKSWRTCTISSNLDPVWDSSWTDFTVFSYRQRVDIKVLDEDAFKNDDFIGVLSDVTVARLMEEPDAWWTLEHPESLEGGSKELAAEYCGELRLVSQFLDFDDTPQSITSRQLALGEEAQTIAMLTIVLRGLRGLPKEKADGAVIKVTVEGQEFTSIKSEYVERELDLVFDPRLKAMDPVHQRLAEVLRHRFGANVKDIASLSGLDEHTLETVMKQRPSFTTRWDHAIHILLVDPLNAEISLRLEIPGEGQNLASRLAATAATAAALGQGNSPEDVVPQLSQPYAVQQLLDRWQMKFDGFMHLKRPEEAQRSQEVLASSGDASKLPGPFDLDVKFQLFGLKPRSAETLGEEMYQSEDDGEAISRRLSNFALKGAVVEKLNKCMSNLTTNDNPMPSQAGAEDTDDDGSKAPVKCRCMPCRRTKRSR